MTGGAEVPGRSNGLPGVRWVHVRDVDPRVVGQILAALRSRDVPAYVTPSPLARGHQLELRLPALAMERLYVDVEHRAAAAAVLDEVLPELEAALRQDDARRESDAETFARLVESFDSAPTEPVGPWSATEDVEPRSRLSIPVEPSMAREDDEQDHFVPPTPPPLPPASTATRYALAAILGGIGVLIVPTLLGDPVGGGLALLAVAAVVGGLVSLVMRMGDRPPTDSGPDDGAVV